MKNLGKNITLRGKLLTGFGIIVLITIFSGAREFTLLEKFDSKRTQANKASEMTNLLNQCKLIVVSEKAIVNNISKATTEKELEDAKNIHSENKSKLQRSLEDVLKLSSKEEYSTYKKNADNITDTISDAASLFNNDIEKAFDKLINNSTEIIDTSFFLKNVSLQPELISDTTNAKLEAEARRALLEKTRYDIKSRSEFIIFQSDILIRKIKNTIVENLKIKNHIIENTDELYKKEAAANILLLLLAVTISILVVIFILRSILKPVTLIEKQLNLLTVGILPENIDINSKDEIGRIGQLLNRHVNRLNETAKFSMEIGKENFSGEYKTLGKDDVLGNSLITMQGSLQSAIEEENKRKIEDLQRSRTSEGLALFAEILRHHTENITELSNDIISNLVKFLNANQGGIFILNDNNPNDIYYDLLGAYAYSRTKYLDKQIRPGEGLVGAVATEKYTVYMTDIPNEYIEIESGVGSANPNSMLIVPLKIEDNVLGVIELASFNNFEKYEIELVEKIAESIAATLSTARINTKTAELLEQSKITTSKMHRQEEEMLQNIEKLKVTQDESNRRETKMRAAFNELENSHKKLADKEERQDQLIKELNTEKNKLTRTIKEKEAYNKNILESSQNAVILFNEFFEIEFFNNPAQKLWKYKEADIEGKTIAELFPENVVKQYSDDKLNAYDIFESGLLTTGSEKKILTKSGEIVPVKFSLSESDFAGKKKYTAFVADIRKEKEKERKVFEEMEATIGAEIEYEIRTERLEKLLSNNGIKIPRKEAAKELIRWSDDYSIDLRVIDQQHRKWVDIVNKLFISFKNGDPEKDVNRIFTEFADYTDYHFSFEEKYMIDFKYTGFKKHKRQHMKLLMDITRQKKRIKEGESVVGYSMMKKLRNWIREHILTEDKEYVELFKEKGLS